MSTYSTNKIELIGTGELDGTWGTSTNTNWAAVEQMISGIVTLDSGDFAANVCTLAYTNTNALQDARALLLSVTATLTAAGTLYMPNTTKLYIIRNTTAGGFALTIRPSVGAATIQIAAGQTAFVYVAGGSLFLVGGNIPVFNLSSIPSVALTNNYDMRFQLLSNTSLQIQVRGTDGVTRATTLTLS